MKHVMLGVHGHVLGHHGGVGHAQTRHALDAQAGVQGAHGVVVGAHAHRAHRVVHGVVGAAHVVGDLLIGLRLHARGELPAGPLCHRRLGDDLPGQSDAGHRDGHVMALRVGEVARVHGRLVPVVVGAQAHGAAGTWRGVDPVALRSRLSSSGRQTQVCFLSSGSGRPVHPTDRSSGRGCVLGAAGLWVPWARGGGGLGLPGPWPPGLSVPWAGERRFLPPEAKTLPVLPPEQGRARFLPTERAGLPVLPTERGRCGTPPPRWARR